MLLRRGTDQCNESESLGTRAITTSAYLLTLIFRRVIWKLEEKQRVILAWLRPHYWHPWPLIKIWISNVCTIDLICNWTLELVMFICVDVYKPAFYGHSVSVIFARRFCYLQRSCQVQIHWLNNATSNSLLYFKSDLTFVLHSQFCFRSSYLKL